MTPSPRVKNAALLPLVLLLGGTVAGNAHAESVPLTQWEKLLPDEEGDANGIVSHLIEGLKNDYSNQGKRVFRDAHPRAQGCVAAKFTVNPQLDAKYQTGIYKTPGKSYDALVRFSSSLGPAGDHAKDARGMAIKVLGVPGKKLLEDQPDALTQDFIQFNAPTFFSQTAPEFAALLAVKETKNVGAYFGKNPLLRAAELSILIGITQFSKYAGKSLLQMQFYSTVPYLLKGPSVNTPIKFSTRPCAPVPDAPLDGGDNELRNDLQDRLQRGDACFEFVYQFYKPVFDVENGIQEWPELIAPFDTVFATITIPKQTFKTDDKLRYCDALSYQPWHALAEHQPLGNVNRARKGMYEAISKFRHETNGESTAQTEPTDLTAWNALTSPTYTVWPAVKVPL